MQENDPNLKRNGWSYSKKIKAKRHFIDGKLSCSTGPAVVYDNGDCSFYVDGLRHRVGGPAIMSKGYRAYFYKDKRHREDGPASIGHRVRPQYYLNDTYIEPGSFEYKMIRAREKTRYNGSYELDQYKVVPKPYRIRARNKRRRLFRREYLREDQDKVTHLKKLTPIRENNTSCETTRWLYSDLCSIIEFKYAINLTNYREYFNDQDMVNTYMYHGPDFWKAFALHMVRGRFTNGENTRIYIGTDSEKLRKRLGRPATKYEIEIQKMFNKEFGHLAVGGWINTRIHVNEGH